MKNESDIIATRLSELFAENEELLEKCIGICVVDEKGNQWRLHKDSDDVPLYWYPENNHFREMEFVPSETLHIDINDWSTQGCIRGLLSTLKESQMVDISKHSSLVSTIDELHEPDEDQIEDGADSWHLFEHKEYGCALALALIYALETL